MVTYHPVTLEKGTSREHFENLLTVLDELEEVKIIFTKANADTEGRIINYMIDEFVEDFKARAPIWKYDIRNGKRVYAKDRSMTLPNSGLLS